VGNGDLINPENHLTVTNPQAIKNRFSLINIKNVEAVMGVLSRAFPLLAALFVFCVGVFFLVLLFIDTPFLEAKSPGSYFLAAISLFFVIAGVFHMVLWKQGSDIQKNADSEIDVRKQAIEKMKDSSLLAKISLEDPLPEVRQTAKERLEALNAD
jgi:hypothetical protein